MTQGVSRRDYTGDPFSEDGLLATPYAQATAWIADARARAESADDVPEPMAISVATVDEQGLPDVRTVLLRFAEPEGWGFVTGLTSTKARQLAAHPVAAASLTWPAMFRAIRIRGRVEELESRQVSDYFQSRPWASRISAWTSEQSAPVATRAVLEDRYAEIARRFPDTGSPDDVPVPPHWGGYRIVPDEVEFWAGRPDRLHDRLVFTRTRPGTMAQADAWSLHRRQP